MNSCIFCNCSCNASHPQYTHSEQAKTMTQALTGLSLNSMAVMQVLICSAASFFRLASFASAASFCRMLQFDQADAFVPGSVIYCNCHIGILFSSACCSNGLLHFNKNTGHGIKFGIKHRIQSRFAHVRKNLVCNFAQIIYFSRHAALTHVQLVSILARFM